jgi:GrpB-like predicted nucleotidyltransferase (UPF0157 family)/RimJ/RimL family protein N-acetyltransferase
MLIETERVGLRPLTLGDLDDVLEIRADFDVVRFVGPLDRDQASDWLLGVERAWAEAGYGRAAIIELATGRFVGQSGLRYWPEFDETEVGWTLRREVWGRGLATEAGHASLRWGFDNLDVPYITAIINPQNARSIAVAQRLGMTVLREDTHFGEPAMIYAMRREDFAPGSGTVDEPVRIVPYDAAWPERFEQERAALASAIAGQVAGGIHHVGSTAVPGLASKPVIDILVGVRDLESSRSCFDRLRELGYVYAPYRSSEMHWFCKPDPSRRTHHLHLVPVDSTRFREELAFRDYLRAHRDVANDYGALKQELAHEFRNDREAYTHAKTDFINAVLACALDKHEPPA